MTLQIVPTLFDGTSHYDQITELDGTNFHLIFSFNSRDEHWYLTIRTEEDEEIIGCEGIKLVQNSWPIRRVYDLNRPLGELYVLGQSSTPAGLYDLGDTTELVYIPRDDFEEVLG